VQPGGDRRLQLVSMQRVCHLILGIVIAIEVLAVQ